MSLSLAVPGEKRVRCLAGDAWTNLTPIPMMEITLPNVKPNQTEKSGPTDHLPNQDTLGWLQRASPFRFREMPLDWVRALQTPDSLLLGNFLLFLPSRLVSPKLRDHEQELRGRSPSHDSPRRTDWSRVVSE